MTIAGQTFSVTQAGTPCTYTIAPTSRTSPAAGESVAVSVTTGSTCAWSTTSNAAWLTVSSGGSGTGNGTVNVVVAANTGTAQRTGTMTVAGQTFSVTQDGAPCTYTIAPTNRTSPAAGESVAVAVTAGSTCTWSTTSNAAWLSVGSGGSGTGNATVNVVVAANTSTAQRTGTMTIAGQTFSVTQDGVPCTYTIAPINRTSPAAGETVAVGVTAGSSCAWSTTSNAAWLSVGSGGSGTGDGSVSVVVAANTGTAQRTGTVTIAGETFTVVQPGTPTCTYAINPTNRTSPAGGESIAVAVTADSSCAWSTTSNAAWLSVGSGATGDGTVNVVVDANTGAIQRIGTVTIAGQTFTVTQAGVTTCTYAVTPAMRTSPTAGETVTVTLTTGASCAWTSTSNASWLTLGSSGTGTGSGNVSVVVAANTGTAQRTGTVTIGGQLFTVTQPGTTSCTYSISPATRTAVATGETFDVTVTTGSTCTWTTTPNSLWLARNPTAGTGNGTVTVTVTANTLTTPRTGTMTIAGQTLTVTQNGAACSFSVTPTSVNAPATGSTGTFAVVTTSGCTWSVTDIPTWMTVTPTSRTGTGGVSFTIAANPGAARSATVVVAGRSIPVTQAGTTTLSAPSNVRIGGQ
jgi:hypothetical protein